MKTLLSQLLYGVKSRFLSEGICTFIILLLFHVSSTEASWITTGNNMYAGVSGNVGVGTTDPPMKLSVVTGGGDGVAVLGDDGYLSGLLGVAGDNWGFLELHGRNGLGDVWIAPGVSYF